MNKKQKKDALVIGIDIHPTCIAAAALDQNGNTLWTHKRVEMKNIHNWLSKNVKSDDILVLEACNNSFEFVRISGELGLSCTILESTAVGQIGKMHCKTDKVDAIKIAKIYQSNLVEKVWVPDHKTIVRREVLGQYQQANKAVTKQKNMITSFLTEHSIQKNKNIVLFSEEGREWMINAYKWDLLELELIDILFDDYFHAVKTKNRLKIMMDKDVTQSLETVQLMKLCGVNTVTAFALMAAIGDIKRFASHKKLVSYLGLAPKVKQSGDNIRYGKTGYSGRKDIKPYLTQGAHAILKANDDYGGQIKNWGWKKVNQKGKNIAVNAMSRRMVTACWHILSGNKSDIEIPERCMKQKVYKISKELGRKEILSMGYKNVNEFKADLKEKFRGAA